MAPEARSAREIYPDAVPVPGRFESNRKGMLFRVEMNGIVAIAYGNSGSRRIIGHGFRAGSICNTVESQPASHVVGSVCKPVVIHAAGRRL